MDESPPPAPPPDVHPWVAAGDHRVRFGVGPQRPDWPALLAWVRLVEVLGFDSFWVQDHPRDDLGAWTTLAVLAVSTDTIRLGTSVSCVYYRSPVELARQAADVDRLSGGRLVLGLGIGDAAREFAQFGLPFPPVPERQAALAETVAIVRGLWTAGEDGGAPFSYAGRHFRVAEAVLRAPPIQRPRVPLLIAGGGERGTLRQVARYADMCNFGGHPYTGGARTLAAVRRKLEALRRHCVAVGRSPAVVLRSHIALPLVLGETPAAVEAKVSDAARQCGGLVAGTPAEALAYYRDLVDAGMRYLLVATSDEETVRLLAEQIMPALNRS